MLGVRPVKPGLSQWCHHPLYTAYTVWCLILFMIWRLTECMCFNLLCKKYIDNIWPDVGGNTDVPVNDRTPSTGGLLDR